MVGGNLFQLLAIFLVGTAGAAATLTTVFRLGERHGNTLMTALDLDELADNTAVRLEEALLANPTGIYPQLRSVFDNTHRRYRQTLRRQIELEASLVTREPPAEVEREGEIGVERVPLDSSQQSGSCADRAKTDSRRPLGRLERPACPVSTTSRSCSTSRAATPSC